MAKKARDIMTREVITVRKSLRVNELIDLFIEHRISAAPVVDSRGRLTGIVTKTDVIGHFMDMDLDLTLKLGLKDVLDSHPGLDGMEVSAETELTVGDIMTPEPVAVRESTTVEKLAEIMIERNIHRLVVTKRGELTGIVSALDILYHVAGKKRK